VAFNFLPCDRDQPYLLPPSLKEWLPEDPVDDALGYATVNGSFATGATWWRSSKVNPTKFALLSLTLEPRPGGAGRIDWHGHSSSTARVRCRLGPSSTNSARAGKRLGAVSGPRST
jgi:hypothetical protein